MNTANISSSISPEAQARAEEALVFNGSPAAQNYRRQYEQGPVGEAI